MRVFRLEFEQPDGRWTGPYCAEWMTERAFEIRTELIAAHQEGDPDRPWPDPELFAANPGPDRLVCGTTTAQALDRWFGRWLLPLLAEGGHLAVCDVPSNAVKARDGHQVIYMQRRAVLLERVGTPVDPDQLMERIHPSKPGQRRPAAGAPPRLGSRP